MAEYKFKDGEKVFQIELDYEPKKKDVVTFEGDDYTVTGTHRINGVTHYDVSGPSVYKKRGFVEI